MSSRFWPNQASSPFRAEDLPPASHHRRCSDGAGGQGRDWLGEAVRRSPGGGGEARREETVRAGEQHSHLPPSEGMPSPPECVPDGSTVSPSETDT